MRHAAATFLILPAVLLLLAALPALAQEPVALVGDDEPGEPLLIKGTVYGPDGEPAVGATVHVHHTNRDGVYKRLGSGDGERIEGEAVTDAEGRYAFRTIRPGAYPGDNGPPAHVHYQVTDRAGHTQGATLRVRDEAPEIVFDIRIGS